MFCSQHAAIMLGFSIDHKLLAPVRGGSECVGIGGMRKVLQDPAGAAAGSSVAVVVDRSTTTAALGHEPRADCMRVYGIPPRHWMPAAACPRESGGRHDKQEVTPACAGIQEPYVQLQAALVGPSYMGWSMPKRPCFSSLGPAVKNSVF